MSRPRAILRVINANRVTCGDCDYLRTLVTGGSNDEWQCDLFTYEANLGLKGARKTPNRAKVCLDAEKAASAV